MYISSHQVDELIPFLVEFRLNLSIAPSPALSVLFLWVSPATIATSSASAPAVAACWSGHGSWLCPRRRRCCSSHSRRRPREVFFILRWLLILTPVLIFFFPFGDLLKFRDVLNEVFREFSVLRDTVLVSDIEDLLDLCPDLSWGEVLDFLFCCLLQGSVLIITRHPGFPQFHHVPVPFGEKLRIWEIVSSQDQESLEAIHVQDFHVLDILLFQSVQDELHSCLHSWDGFTSLILAICFGDSQGFHFKLLLEIFRVTVQLHYHEETSPFLLDGGNFQPEFHLLLVLEVARSAIERWRCFLPEFIAWRYLMLYSLKGCRMCVFHPRSAPPWFIPIGPGVRTIRELWS